MWALSYRWQPGLVCVFLTDTCPGTLPVGFPLVIWERGHGVRVSPAGRNWSCGRSGRLGWGQRPGEKRKWQCSCVKLLATSSGVGGLELGWPKTQSDVWGGWSRMLGLWLWATFSLSHSNTSSSDRERLIVKAQTAGHLKAQSCGDYVIWFKKKKKM